MKKKIFTTVTAVFLVIIGYAALAASEERIQSANSPENQKTPVWLTRFEEAQKTAEKEKKRIVRFLKDSDENALLNAYLKMNPGKRILVEPYVIPDDEYAEKWQELKYTGGLFDEDDSVYYTKRGDRVRSKSEQMIADRLFDAHIPYRYEFPLVYDGTKHIFTDFTVLNKRTRVTYRWEHFGKMDDPKYRKTFFWKQSVYSQLGYTQGLNLVFTFEDNDNPLDMRVVDRLIKRLFL